MWESGMNKKQQQELNNLKCYEQEYGYIALDDYSSYHYLSSLDKIIKLKNQNRKLCAKRAALKEEVFDKSQSNGWFVAIALLTVEIAKLSEQIGKNGHKIQRLRTKYKQYGEKWKAGKLRPKDLEDICY